MAFFKIIIPNYNNEQFLPKCLNSILNQTYQDFSIIIIDDMSTDDSRSIITEYTNEHKNITPIFLKEKRWNGGSRNIGIKIKDDSKYTLFIDSDDWYENNNCLQTIYDTIVQNSYPDCVTLSYNCVINDNHFYQSLIRNSQKELVESLYVACWTKCIKTELIQLFPENTLMEDVVQHIAQCDKLKTFCSVSNAIVEWNRNNPNSCSREENQNLQQGKWQSSMYRYAADLLELKCENGVCEEHRLWRLSVVLNNIKEGKYIQ